MLSSTHGNLFSIIAYLNLIAISTPACTSVEVYEAEQAIINGQLDTGHRQVVKLFATDPGTQQIEYCTGTLVASKTVVTAAHCVFAASGQQYPAVTVEGEMRYYDPELRQYYYDSFDMVSAGITPHPSYAPLSSTGTDVAVVTLPSPVSGVAPANLGGAPGPGAAITIVGFGATSGSPPYPGYGESKRWGSNTIDRVDAALIYYSGVTGSDAGTCFGDSGGPNFLGGYTSNCLTAVTKGGSSYCSGLSNYATRVDTGVSTNTWIRSQTTQSIVGC